jgi:hypothetical protein
VAVLLCALVASLAIAAAPAAADLPLYEADLTFPTIKGPSDPEEYSWQVRLAANQTLLEVDETEAEVRYESGLTAFLITAEPAHAADGATVPTTLSVSEGDVLTETVHHLAGNPAAGGAPFDYPVMDGLGWEGPIPWEYIQGPADEAGIGEQFRRAEEVIFKANPAAPTEAPPVPHCTVPSLHGYNLRGAKNRLRAGHCAIGQVHLAGGASVGKGKVVKQFEPAGTELAAGAPVAVKLGSR